MSTSAAPDTPSTPASYDAGCAAAAFGLAATLLLHSRANQALRSRSFSAKRLLYSMILRLAPAVAIVNFIACTAPGLHKGAALAQHTLVALVMACFMELLLLLLFRISLCKSGEEEAQAPGISNVLEHFEASFSKFERQFEPSEYIDGVVRVMRQQPNIAYFASPPIGCCFALCPFLPCGRPQPPTAMLVATLRRAVLVCAAGAVLVPLFALWVDHVPAMAAHREAIQQLAHGLELGVTLLALYSLFITYRLSKVPLKAYSTTLKFASVKILVFVTPLQRTLLVHYFGATDGAWWSHVVTVLEAPLLSLLLVRAFPASELPVTPPRGSSDSPDEASQLLHAKS